MAEHQRDALTDEATSKGGVPVCLGRFEPVDPSVLLLGMRFGRRHLRSDHADADLCAACTPQWTDTRTTG